MKRILIALALVAVLAVPAFASLGFYTELSENFVAGTDGILPAVSWEFGYVLPQSGPVSFSASLFDPNILTTDDSLTLDTDLGLDFSDALSGDLSNAVTFDFQALDEGLVKPLNWTVGVGLTWNPSDYATFSAGLKFVWVNGPNWATTPYASLRFDL